MKFNSKKFQYINFGIHPEDKDSNVYVGPDLNLINALKTVKDLGVTMSNDCMFDQHIHNVVKRSSQLCGWILRTFQARSSLLMLTVSSLPYLSQLYYLGLIMVLNCGHPAKKDIYVNLREYNDHLQSIFLGCKIYHIIRDLML